MENRDELLAKLRKKIKGKRGGRGGGKPAIDYNKLQQLTENMQTNQGEIDDLRAENKRLKDSLSMLMNPQMKDALANYKKLLQENKELKDKLAIE